MMNIPRSAANALASLYLRLFKEFIMGMRISGSGATSATQSTAIANWQQRQQSFKDLNSALQSGDLAGAQKAFSGLTGGADTMSGSGPLAQIGQALQNGDLAGAQKAGQQLLAGRAGHHHGHHRAQAASSTPATPSSGPGSLINLTA